MYSVTRQPEKCAVFTFAPIQAPTATRFLWGLLIASCEVERRTASFADDVMRAAQLAAALEVSGWPKPGNVHRTADFADTRFEHFIAGSIALGPAVREAARRGLDAGAGKLKLSELEVGRLIFRAVSDVKKWHRGGNTHLGISLLFIPIACGAGVVFAARGAIDRAQLRQAATDVVNATTWHDSSLVFDAILLATSAALGKLESVEAPDLADRSAKDAITARKVPLIELMRVSSEWDNVAREWATGFEAVFEVGAPTFLDVANATDDVNVATVHTFLTLLARYPDTLIARKIGVQRVSDIKKAVKLGLEVSKEVAREASRVLRLGGLLSPEGREALQRLDRELRDPKNQLNPGTTADLTAASIFVALLCGYRP